MNVTGNGVQKELKLNLQNNTTLFKTYKMILSGKLTTCFCLANKVPFLLNPEPLYQIFYPYPPQLTPLAEERRRIYYMIYNIKYKMVRH